MKLKDFKKNIVMSLKKNKISHVFIKLNVHKFYNKIILTSIQNVLRILKISIWKLKKNLRLILSLEIKDVPYLILLLGVTESL